MMSFPICGLSSSVRLALLALDSTSDARNTADSNLREGSRRMFSFVTFLYTYIFYLFILILACFKLYPK